MVLLYKAMQCFIIAVDKVPLCDITAQCTKVFLYYVEVPFNFDSDTLILDSSSSIWTQLQSSGVI